ncbi:RNA polymerase sigma-54 factor [Lactobacillus johnsonii]|uniref:RNA polymerase factor sigma-54 n=2 Tax=Lactobacillus johnsonii TaxID=33959 RepID=A0A9X5AKY0_LACJH|nr:MULTISPECIES: RNA polymerase factor sigma-54 [Lactobacillus]AYN49278.1 RNA polymerase sigma-54 factor [Lactobacillus johnsonii]MCT3381831.1 RNA polymerase sigma-54 factor [Lactobacillus johnsonii]MCT3387658.1 RNA polymerase sigma-54 factor [Lactobacillus johnsonii]MTE02379.1 RNA polymerase factor sigma-54 [Lactobacillus johnsonii]OUL54589.1 RNA polymerase sigma-54 factor [Lactobacillus johnsonii]
MMQAQSMSLKVQEKLVTRLFLSTKLRQDLKILSYNAYDLSKVIQEFAQENPFVELKNPRKELQNLDWIQDNETENLIDHLLSQVRVSDWSSKEKRAVTFLIYQLGEDGYLRTSLEALKNRASFSLQELKAGRDKLQKLDPIGIGAKDLNECLLLQARDKKDFNELALTILEKEKLEVLADPSKWPEFPFKREKIIDALKAIQSLNPAPASEYELGEPTQYLIPDLKFYFEDGRLMISSFRSNLPEIVFDDEKFIELEKDSEAVDEKYFIKRKKNFIDLHYAIQQREETLLKLGKFLGRRQEKYLSSLKEQDLVSIKLEDAANELNLAISTISRAIKDKYVECQGKVFSLKLLFPRKSISNLTQNQLEKMLKDFIKLEDPKNSLSDEQLVNRFKEKGISISRRTISKYRKKLGIKNSYQRNQK